MITIQKLLFPAFPLLMVASGFAQQQVTITASSGNILCNGTCVKLDVPDLNNNKDAIIISVTPVLQNAVNPNPWTISVDYNNYGDLSWHIHNLGNQDIKKSAQFIVAYYVHPDSNQFVHVVTDYQSLKEGSVIDHTGLNNNPNARFQFIQTWTPSQPGRFYNLIDAVIHYNNVIGRWCIFNNNNTKVPTGAAYNIAIAPGSAVIKTFAGQDSLPVVNTIKDFSTNAAPVIGQVLKWNGTAWIPGNDSTCCTASNNNNAGSGWSLSGANLYNSTQGNVGIAWKNSNTPLGFSPSLGKKISLYPGATGDAGFAVQGNLLQIYADNPNADVAIGYDQAGTFTERFRVKANGALAVNGNTGQPGQVLQSSGASSAPTWVNLGPLKIDILKFDCTDPVLTSGNDWYTYDISGLDQTINLPTASKVIVNMNEACWNKGCSNCGMAKGYFKLYIDDMVQEHAKAVLRAEVDNDGASAVSIESTGPMVFTLDPGNHRFRMKFFRNKGGGDIEILTGKNQGTSMTIIILPQ